MITEEMIEAALDDIDDGELGSMLMDSNEIGYLADAIASVAQGAGREHLDVYINQCIQYVRDRHWECAEKIAKEKDDRARFQADMEDADEDEDWDDYKMEMTA